MRDDSYEEVLKIPFLRTVVVILALAVQRDELLPKLLSWELQPDATEY